MGYKHGGVAALAYHSGLCLIKKRVDRCASAASLAYVDKVSLVVNVHYGLDAEHRAYDGGGGAYSAASLEEEEVVYREPMAEIELYFLNVVAHSLDALACKTLLSGKINEKSLTERCRKCINRVDLSLGILFGELLCGDLCARVGAAKTRGKSEIENILAFLENRLHSRLKLVYVDGGGRCLALGAKEAVKLLDVYLTARLGLLALDGYREVEHSQVKLACFFFGKVRA